MLLKIKIQKALFLRKLSLNEKKNITYNIFNFHS